MIFLKSHICHFIKLVWNWSLKCYLICDLRFYHRYYWFLEANVAKNQMARLLMKFFQFIVILQTFHLTFTMLFRNQLSETDNVLFGSMLYFEQTSFNLNQTLWIEPFNLLVLILMRIIYFENTGITAHLMRKTLFENDQSFWIYPKLNKNNKNIIKQLFRLLGRFSFLKPPKNQTEFFRFAAVLLLNMFHSIHYFILLYAATVQYRSYFLLRDSGLFNTVQNTFVYNCLKYAVFQIKFAFYGLYLMIFLNIFITVEVLALLTNWIAWQKLQQINHFVVSFSPKVFSEKRVTRCRQLSVEYLFQLADANRIFGRSLFMFLFLATPSNSYMIMMVLLTRAKQDQSSAIIFKSLTMIIVCNQLVLIFGTHWSAAKMTLLFHQPVRHLMKVALFNKRLKNNFQVQLGLAHYIEAFHTVNQYCVTYGKYGAITFSSYKKVIFRKIY